MSKKKTGLAIQGLKGPLQHYCTSQYFYVFLNIRFQRYLKVPYFCLVFSIEIYGRLQVVHFQALELKNAKPFFLDTLYAI